MVVAGRAGWMALPQARHWLVGVAGGLAVVRAGVDALGVAGGAVARGLTGRAAVQPAGLVRVVRVRGLLVRVAGRRDRDGRVGADLYAVVVELAAAPRDRASRVLA